MYSVENAHERELQRLSADKDPILKLNEKLEQEVSQLKHQLKTEKTHLSMVEIGAQGELQISDVVTDTFDCDEIDSHSIANKADRHYVGKKQHEGKYWIVEAKNRGSDTTNGSINQCEINAFREAVENEQKADFAAFICVTQSATQDPKLPGYKERVQFLTVERDGRADTPILLLVTTSKRTIQLALWSLMEMSNKCSQIFDQKNKKHGDKDSLYKDLYNLQEDLVKDIENYNFQLENCRKNVAAFRSATAREEENMNRIQGYIDDKIRLKENLNNEVNFTTSFQIILEHYKRTGNRTFDFPCITSGPKRDILKNANLSDLRGKLKQWCDMPPDEDRVIQANRKKSDDKEKISESDGKKILETFASIKNITLAKRFQNLLIHLIHFIFSLSSLFLRFI